MERKIELNKAFKFILFSKELNEYEKLVLCAFASIENELDVHNQYFQVYQTWLETQLNISLSEIKRVITSLSDKGILSVLKCRKNGHLTNAYKIIWDKLVQNEPINYKRKVFIEDINKDIEAEKKKKEEEAKTFFVKNGKVDLNIINSSKYLKYDEKSILGSLLIIVAYSTNNDMYVPYNYIKNKQNYDKSTVNKILHRLSEEKIIFVSDNHFKINYFNLAVKMKIIDDESVIDSMFI